LINRQNYIFIVAHLDYLREVKQVKPISALRYRAHLRHLLIWADETHFADIERIRPSFASHLVSLNTQHPERSASEPRRRITPAVIRKIMSVAKRFLLWLKTTHPAQTRALSVAWVESLASPRLAENHKDHQLIAADEALQLMRVSIPDHDLALRRDKAAAALMMLSGMRSGAMASLTIACIDLPNRAIKQWPQMGVRTKNSKTATTYLLNIPALLAEVAAWDAIVRAQLPPTATWYAPIITEFGEQRLSHQSPGAHRNTAFAKRMKRLFALAGLPYKSPHKFRHGHAVFALQHAKTMADYKAVSMNLMHSDIRVTDAIYAPLLNDEVQHRITNLIGTAPSATNPMNQLVDQIDEIGDDELVQALRVIAQRLPKK
jgi:integrase